MDKINSQHLCIYHLTWLIFFSLKKKTLEVTIFFIVGIDYPGFWMT